jgi:hypothetical protein
VDAVATEEMDDLAVFRVIDIFVGEPDQIDRFERVADRLMRLVQHLRQSP